MDRGSSSAHHSIFFLSDRNASTSSNDGISAIELARKFDALGATEVSVIADELYPKQQHFPPFRIDDLLRKSHEKPESADIYLCLAGICIKQNHYGRLISDLMDRMTYVETAQPSAVMEPPPSVSASVSAIATASPVSPRLILERTFEPRKISYNCITPELELLPTIDLKKEAEKFKMTTSVKGTEKIAKAFGRFCIAEMARICPRLQLFTIRQKRGATKLLDFPEPIIDRIIEASLAAFGLGGDEMLGTDEDENDRHIIKTAAKSGIMKKLEDLRRERNRGSGEYTEEPAAKRQRLKKVVKTDNQGSSSQTFSDSE